MPPPTMNIAAVPAIDSSRISRGAKAKIARPSRARRRRRPSHQRLAEVVEPHDAGDQAVDADVIIARSRTSTAMRTPTLASATVPSVMTTISADRMKSVRTAPAILAPSRRRPDRPSGRRPPGDHRLVVRGVVGVARAGSLWASLWQPS
jgi:hypothetical protein